MHLYSQASTAWTQASYGHWVPGVGGHGDHLIDDRRSKEAGWGLFSPHLEERRCSWLLEPCWLPAHALGLGTVDPWPDRGQSSKLQALRGYVLVRITEQSLWKLVFFSNNFCVDGSGDGIFILWATCRMGKIMSNTNWDASDGQIIEAILKNPMKDGCVLNVRYAAKGSWECCLPRGRFKKMRIKFRRN